MKKNLFKPSSGAALVVVLCLIVLVLGVAITFLMRVRIERNASSSEGSAAITRSLADVTVNLVEGQVRDATTLGINAAWTSQPGMIRTFAAGAPGSLTPSSDLFRAYKLYSAAELVSMGPVGAGADAPPSDWATRPAFYTDLNAPVTAGGKAQYPILDPGSIEHVEGFTVANAPVQGTSNTVPMPVLWLYVLENGSLVAPTAGSASGKAKVAGSEVSPIVGRVAFWTDDESCKININTASEGTYWDIPKGNTQEERALARYQPFQHEFQRYPGHPAMTSLAPVLFATSSTTTPVLTDAQREAIYTLTPRVVGGGSQGGTKLPMTSSGTFVDPLQIDTDRLYSNVDELIFNASRSNQDSLLALDQSVVSRSRFFLTASSRAPEVNLFNTPRVAIWPLDENGGDYWSAYDKLIARCATVNNRRYFFTRRLPITQNGDQPDTQITRNVQLYKYLQALTALPVPGFGNSASFLTKYPQDRDQILTEIYDYIRATNINDPLLPIDKRFYYRNGVQYGLSAGGLIVPSKGSAGFNTNTAGFGNFPVISEAAIHFICTADGGDGSPGGIAGSNATLGPAPDTTPRNRTLSTLLKAKERRIEALMRFELFAPGQGFPWVTPRYTMRVIGLNTFSVLTQSGTLIPLGFPQDARDSPGCNPDALYGSLSAGGVISARNALSFPGGWGPSYPDGTTGPEGAALIRTLGSTMPSDVLNPGYSGDANPSQQLNTANWDRPYPYISIPITVNYGGPGGDNMTFNGGTFTVELYASDRADPTSTGADSSHQKDALVASYIFRFPPQTIPIPQLVTSNRYGRPMESFWTFSNDGIWPLVGGKPAIPGRVRYARDATHNASAFLSATQFEPEDVVRSLVPSGHSDYRLMAKSFINPVASPLDAFQQLAPTGQVSHAMVESGRADGAFGVQLDSLVSGVTYAPNSRPDVAIGNAASSANGDWDNGAAMVPDGTYINRPDEGNAFGLAGSNSSYNTPYFDIGANYDNSTSLFSPNRELPSAFMFGSLPTGIISQKPFQTLLFRPQTGHPGAADPKDHLLADLFWMPVVEPYAISEPFSTAGKVNMNYQIEPFNYIRRATGLAAVFRAEKIIAINRSVANTYKDVDGLQSPTSDKFRLAIDTAETLKQFDAVFAAGDVFRSPTQIAEIRLIPVGETNTSVDDNFWSGKYRLTGDNSRERPYTNLLGRLTTKSNAFAVHMRVQALKKSPKSTVGEWDEAQDKVTGEYRGSATIERYLTPDDPAIPNYASSSPNPTAQAPLGNFYRWRTLYTRQFAP